MGWWYGSDSRRLERIESAVQRIEALMIRSLTRSIVMARELDDLQAEVARNTDVEQSALTLIQGLRDQLDQAGTDPVKLQALREESEHGYNPDHHSHPGSARRTADLGL
jgi:hypothetical protein